MELIVGADRSLLNSEPPDFLVFCGNMYRTFTVLLNGCFHVRVFTPPKCVSI